MGAGMPNAVPGENTQGQPHQGEADEASGEAQQRPAAVGEIEGGDNTRDILSDGGLWAARAIQKQLGLSPIKELVTVISSSSGS